MWDSGYYDINRTKLNEYNNNYNKELLRIKYLFLKLYHNPDKKKIFDMIKKKHKPSYKIFIREEKITIHFN